MLVGQYRGSLRHARVQWQPRQMGRVAARQTSHSVLDGSTRARNPIISNYPGKPFCTELGQAYRLRREPYTGREPTGARKEV